MNNLSIDHTLLEINKTKGKQIKLIVSDVDGVLTDGSLFINENVEEPFVKFSIYDGMGVNIAHACGLKIAILSGRKSLSVEARCNKLGIDEVYTGVENKKQKLQEIANRLSINLEQIVYIGDDFIDLPAINIVGLKVAPPNAMQIVKNSVDFVTKTAGGHGALRELIEYILVCQGKYDSYIQQFLE